MMSLLGETNKCPHISSADLDSSCVLNEGQSEILGSLGEWNPLPNMYVIRGAEQRFLGERYSQKPGSASTGVPSGGEGLNLLLSTSKAKRAGTVPCDEEGNAKLWCLFPGDGGGLLRWSEMPCDSDNQQDQSRVLDTSARGPDDSQVDVELCSTSGGGKLVCSVMSMSFSSLARISESTELLYITLSKSISSELVLAEACDVTIGLTVLGLLVQGRTWPTSNSRTATSSATVLVCMLARSLDEQRLVVDLTRLMWALSAASCAVFNTFEINRAFLKGSSVFVLANLDNETSTTLLASRKPSILRNVVEIERGKVHNGKRTKRTTHPGAIATESF